MAITSFAEGEIPDAPGFSSGEVIFTAAGTRRHHLASTKRALASWTTLVKDDPSPVAHDSAELANLAFRRWSYYRSDLDVASSLSDLRAKIRNNPNAEIAVLLLAKAPRLRDRRVRMNIVGLSLFRRTWANNIFLDILARHPYAGVSRVGTILLWYVARIASALGADAVWGETTQNSVEYYKKAFGTEFSDLLYIDKD